VPFMMHSGSWGTFEGTAWVEEHSGSTRESESGKDLAFYWLDPLSFVVEESGILAGPIKSLSYTRKMDFNFEGV